MSDDQINDQEQIDEYEPENIEGETKEEKFRRLGYARYRKTVKCIRLIGNLSGPSYAYTDESVTNLFNLLRAELDHAESRFSSQDDEVIDPFA